jgi:hypothetical protein
LLELDPSIENQRSTEFAEPLSQGLGKQNPWAVQYPARLWDQGSINNTNIIREAEKRVMRLADSTKYTLSCVFSGFSNINPNDFVENCHRSVACAEYWDSTGNPHYFSAIEDNEGGEKGNPENPLMKGAFVVSSANSSNVAVLTARTSYYYEKLLSLGQVPYIKFNKFNREQTVGGILRIKSIKAPIITIAVTGGEPENYKEIEEALIKEYTKIGGEGTVVRASMGVKHVEYFRGNTLCRDKVMSGEIRLTITLPPGVDIELPTGPVDIDLGERGLRNLFAYQFGSKSLCKLCGGNSCFNSKENVKRCLNRCKHCGLSFSQNHIEETCPKQFDEATVEQKWLVNKIEEDLLRKTMPVVDLSADAVKVKLDMEARKSSSWREGVSRDVHKQVKRIVDDSKFGAEHDINPYRDLATREKMLVSKGARRKMRRNKRNGTFVDGENSVQSRLVDRVEKALKHTEAEGSRGEVVENIYTVRTQASATEGEGVDEKEERKVDGEDQSKEEEEGDMQIEDQVQHDKEDPEKVGHMELETSPKVTVADEGGHAPAENTGGGG